jgi:hypothetical protein
MTAVIERTSTTVSLRSSEQSAHDYKSEDSGRVEYEKVGIILIL